MKRRFMLFLMLGASFILGTAATAQADPWGRHGYGGRGWHGGGYGWHHPYNRWGHHGWRGPGPYYYGYRPPVYYAPPPVYYGPPVFSLRIR